MGGTALHLVNGQMCTSTGLFCGNAGLFGGNIAPLCGNILAETQGTLAETQGSFADGGAPRQVCGGKCAQEYGVTIAIYVKAL